MHVQQVPVGQVSTEIAAALQDFDLPRLQRNGFDVGVLHPTDRGRRCEQDGVRARQYLWPAVRNFAGPQFGHWLGWAAPARNPHQRSEKSHCRHDISVVAPTGALCASRSAQYAGQRNRRSALDRELFKLAVGEEPNPLSIGREERVEAALSTRQQRGFGLVEQARSELLLTICAARRKHQPAAVRRNGDRAVCARRRVRLQINAEAGQLMVRLSCCVPGDPACCYRDDCEHCRCAPPVTTPTAVWSSNNSQTSPMSRKRFLGSFSRQRPNRRRTFAGTGVRSGSFITTAANMSGMVFPMNGGLPVTIW